MSKFQDMLGCVHRFMHTWLQSLANQSYFSDPPHSNQAQSERLIKLGAVGRNEGGSRLLAQRAALGGFVEQGQHE